VYDNGHVNLSTTQMYFAVGNYVERTGLCREIGIQCRNLLLVVLVIVFRKLVQVSTSLEPRPILADYNVSIKVSN